jgi:phage terminase large subunit
MELEIKHTNIFTRNLEALEASKRFIINQGSSRSSKTYSIVQLLIFKCLTESKLKVSIVRKSFPALRGSILKDFIEIMQTLEIYDENEHNKTEHIYQFKNGSMIEFFSIDDSQKVRGRKRDICYCNEGNELSREEFMQLSLRTTQTLIIDFNPSDDEHWLYSLCEDNRSILIKSTYKDNIYLEQSIIDEIENLINVDENYYKIYALGERPSSTARIYNHFKQYVDQPKETQDYCYGLDFGFTHVTALSKTSFIDNKVYVEELLYKEGLTSTDIIRELKTLNLDLTKPIYCDAARPEIIEDLKRNGFRNATQANKAVLEGIDKVKSMEVYVHYESLNIIKESKLYSWKTKGEQILNEPIKLNDDILDSIRYSIYSHHKAKKKNSFIVSKIF